MQPLNPDEVKSVSETLHHECDPAARLDEADKFSEKLRALIEGSHKPEVPLADCTLERLESEGHIKEKF